MITILFLAANPVDGVPLRIDQEVRAIDQALRGADLREQFVLQQHWAVRVADLQTLLLRVRPTIVHFSGHGNAAGEIVLEDAAGHSQPVTAAALQRLFGLFKDNIRCVVLNACYSEMQAVAIAAEIDAVAGMSSAIADEAAISFAAAFYQALGYGKDVATAFAAGCLQLQLEGLGEADAPRLLALRSAPGATVLTHPLAASAPTTPAPQTLPAASSVHIGSVGGSVNQSVIAGGAVSHITIGAPEQPATSDVGSTRENLRGEQDEHGGCVDR